MITMVESFMVLEEKLNTCFDNPTSVEAHSSRSAEKKSYRCRDESDRGMQMQYDKYAPMSLSLENIYYDYANT